MPHRGGNKCLWPPPPPPSSSLAKGKEGQIETAEREASKLETPFSAKVGATREQQRGPIGRRSMFILSRESFFRQ